MCGFLGCFFLTFRWPSDYDRGPSVAMRFDAVGSNPTTDTFKMLILYLLLNI